MATLTTLDGSLTLESERYGETYRSARGAVTESRHVFLAASGTRERLEGRGAASVLEVGFGTGLNFLVTAAAAAESEASLTYVALDRDPLPPEALASLRYDELLAPYDGPAALLDWLASLGDGPGPGLHRFRHGEATLDLVVGEAREVTRGWKRAIFDAVYLDPFSPKANPDGWEEGFLTALAGLLAPAGRLVTYSVSGEVRRRLAAAGLRVSKTPGPPGGKRESLVAIAPEPGANG